MVDSIHVIYFDSDIWARNCVSDIIQGMHRKSLYVQTLLGVSWILHIFHVPFGRYMFFFVMQIPDTLFFGLVYVVTFFGKGRQTSDKRLWVCRRVVVLLTCPVSQRSVQL